MRNVIKKAVFPLAGMGASFLPATKANPKEMMPIVDKPLVQFAVEEAISAGIKEMIFVTSSSKRSIEDHFDGNFELEEKLKSQGKEELLDIVQNIIPQGVSCAYIRQPAALGLGHAILCTKRLIDNEPFAILLADVLIEAGQNSCLKQMVEKFETVQSGIVAIQKIKAEEVEKYGMVGFNKNIDEIAALEKINQIVEKPKLADAPSPFGVIGRYILTPTVFSLLEKVRPDNTGKIQLTDAISQLLQVESIYAHQFTGASYDCGNKLGYLQAIVSLGLKHKDVGNSFKEYLSTLHEQNVST